MGQSPVAEFTVSLLPCLDQNIDVDNTSMNADSFEWDFCLDDFKTLSSNTDLATVIGLSGGFGYRIVEDDGLWFGFVVSQSTHSIIRLDFGDSPTNTPAVVDLGNPGNTLLFPQGIDLYKNNGVWFAFVGYNDNNYGLVRLNFGASLTNIPSAVNLGNFGVTGRFWDLKIVKQAADLILVIIERNTGSIVRVNYRDSFLNSITIPTHVFNTGPVSGAALTPGIDVAKKGANWFIFLTSSSNKVYQVSFGSNILGSAVVDASYGFSGINNPFRIRVGQEGTNYFAAVTNQSAAMAVIDLKDLDIANPPIEVTFSGLPQLLAVDVIRYRGKSIVQGVGNVNNKLRQLLFEATCGASVDFSEQASPNPVSYTLSGSKKIELKVFNSGSGEHAIAGQQITVSGVTAPDIAFTTQNVCANNDVIFTSQNSSENITDYNWDFDDTNTLMGLNPTTTHQYTTANLYEVSLEVIASNGCTNIARQPITIYDEPVADFDLPSVSPICTNQNYLFANTSAFDVSSNPTWEWEVNGTPVSTNLDLNYTIPLAVMQDVKLKVAIPGCQNEIIKSINTVEVGPLVDFTFSNGCEDSSISFENNTTGGTPPYNWNFGDGNVSTQTSPNHVYSDFGNYNVTLDVTNAAGCNNSKVKPIQIYSKPQPDFSLDLPPFSCSGSASQFNDLTPNPVDSNLAGWVWSFNDPVNGTSTDRNPLYVYDEAGGYNVGLVVTTNFGCQESIQKPITITPSPGAEFSYSPACVNQGTVFTPISTDADSWQWKIGNATYNIQNPTHVFNSPATFTAQLTTIGSNGCISILSKQVAVPTAISVDFKSENNCANQGTLFTDLTTFGADSPQSRVWQFSTLGNGSGISDSFTFPSAGSYPTKLTVTNVSGCSYSISKNVTIVDSPVATFSATPQVGTPPLTVKLLNTTNNVISQLWNVNDAKSSTSTESAPTFTFTELGEYVVDLTVANASGCTNTTSKIISVIVPSLDVSLTALTLVPATSGETNILISILNKSNSTVGNIKVFVEIGGSAIVSEFISAAILPGQSHTQLLATSVAGVKTDNNYICVEIEVDGDKDNSNNKRCVNQDPATIVFEPYPNPGSQELSIEWVAVSAGSAELYLFDPMGRKVFETALTNFDEGFNKATIDLSSVNPGMYYVLFVTENKRRSFPYMVRR